MPSKKRKNRKRRLWLNIKVRAPKGTSKEVIKETLIGSIHDGEYKLPRGWSAKIEWRNKEMASMRGGKWAEEMMESAASSPGFDLAVISYLDRW